MAIYFEKRSEGETTFLSVCGTREDIVLFAEALKQGVALQTLRIDADPALEIRDPELRSTSFDRVEIVVADKDEILAIAKRGKRKTILVWAIWLVIVASVILLWANN